jgi:hypothetical protein
MSIIYSEGLFSPIVYSLMEIETVQVLPQMPIQYQKQETFQGTAAAPATQKERHKLHGINI